MKICGTSRKRMIDELNKMKEEREKAAFLDQCILLPYSVKENNLVSEPEGDERASFEKDYQEISGYSDKLFYPFLTVNMAASLFILSTAVISWEALMSEKGEDFEKAGSFAVKYYADKMRLFSQEDLEKDPYIKKMKFNGEGIGNNKLIMQPYDKWHICISSDFRESGYFYGHDIAVATEDILVPALKCGNEVEERVCMSEILLTKKAIERAHGKVLAIDVTSLQYFSYMVHLKEDVESVSVFLSNNSSREIFEKFVLPKFDHPEKIQVVDSSSNLDYSIFDFCFARVWDEFYTNLRGYVSTLQLFKMLPGIECFCYMEPALLEHIKNIVVLDTLFHMDSEINFGVQASDEDIDYIAELFKNVNITTPAALRNIMQSGKIKEFLQANGGEKK